ncbi:MAG: ABC transporter substrate-binding protein [Rhodospirillales bacterium]|nr:ABC transporter substrate-binding protein [Rhodospirillales bacterium]MDE2198261.1 ABC transporter substrate-binding protein [Rhodospirillales bacterium]MDE2574935.1 ABC transporter substrate-binding protein [Rhodospirillales bacterium]
MKRRSFLAGTLAAGGAALAAPRIAAAQGSKVLKFIPQSDVTILDPIWTTAYVTRNHGYLVFDTLFGTDAQYKVSPQMAAGMTTDKDGKLVRITLRDGLKWHDGERVLARDCVASIQRWGKRDTYGQTLMDVTDELTAADDRTIQFRLKKPFALVAEALGKSASSFPAMMPERLAKTDPFTQITEMVGSGPYTFNAKERVVGSRVVYDRFAGYVPRQGGVASGTAGPKIAHFDRVEWHVVPDAATAAGALQNNEVDWWENPTNDMLPLLRGHKDLVVEIQDPTGLLGCMRFNHLTEPFNNPAIRRAVLKVINQQDFVTAVAGTDPKMWHVPDGVFCPGTPMASEAGLDVFKGPRDYAGAKKEILAAGYKGEKVVLLAPTNFPILKALADVCADALGKAGLNVDYQAMDWGTVIQRRAKKDPISQGGWSVFNTFWAGSDQFNPVGHAFLRGDGPQTGTIGWPTSPKLEALRQQWIDAPDLAAQKKIAEEMQLQALIDVPYVPLGQTLAATAFNKKLTGVLDGFVTFWNVQKA